MSIVNDLSTITNNVGESILNTTGEVFDAMEDTFNAIRRGVVFGSNDRRHGYIGLILGPIYSTMWENLSITVTTMLGMGIGNYCNFNDRMYGYMTRLMLINLWEHNTTLSMLCESGSNQANPNSQSITHEAQMPSYTNGNNYLQTIREINNYEVEGQNSTTIDIPKNVYFEVKNLYPDDNDQRAGDFNYVDVWDITNTSSILYKTKCLFRQRKIKSLISRFGTNTDANPEETNIPVEGNARTDFGLSHGRNLLTKEAEDGGISYNRNGYNNPYCRVWTHHYQYDKYNKTIRPFNGEGIENNLENQHLWSERWWLDQKDIGFKEGFAWKSSGTRWNKTVLNGRGDGLINITPHFSGGGKANIHSKDCMFSIENLAWKDYDPYSFETALSWEQRGPLGGRIMWFPPYGLTFNETSQAQWNANTFIGRGEDVYTYVNTKRTGVLTFYLIVDHPSILDYVSWYEANRDNVKDTDILRYFAGCDPNDQNDPNSLLHYAQPTPLTDEGGDLGSKLGEKVTPYVPKETPPGKTEKVEFIVYFPNNYSGIFDINNSKIGGVDFVIDYLLAGVNSQEMHHMVDNTPKSDPIVYQNADLMFGSGYEMESDNGITSELSPDVYIIGNKYKWEIPAKNYVPDNEKIWKYRIDGSYDVPETDKLGQLNNIYSNTYAQKLKNANSYKDINSHHLNSSLENQYLNYGKTKEDIPDTAYTFTEVVQAVAEVSQNEKLIKFFTDIRPGINNSEEHKTKIETLKKLFTNTFTDGKEKNSLKSIEFIGFSNSQGANTSKTVNNARNEILAKGRAETIEKWLLKSIPSWANVPISKNYKPSVKVNSNDGGDLMAKIYRAVKCTMLFEQDDTVNLTDSDEKDNSENFQFYEANGETFANQKLYKLAKDDGSRWVKLEDGQMAKVNFTRETTDYANEQFWLDIMNGKTGENNQRLTIENADKDTLYNKIRYDQEYHFFRRVKEETPLIYKSLMDKIQYFDPAFHSMTPEGFNARCTFLNQCTRQGNTVGVSDRNRLSASNMAFGRPPFCVLRLGDFYNQMIVIDSVNIRYDTSGGIVWDLNDEGVGVQPMLAEVSLNFTFIGGGSLDGPIRRLQNAMSFNYYANSELYDNRADQAVYNYGDLTMGGAGKGNLDIENSKFRNVGIYEPEKLY